MNADPCGSGSTALVTSNIRILDPNPQYLSSSRSDYLKVWTREWRKRIRSTALICMVSVSQFGSFFVWLLVCFSQYLCFLSSILFSFQFVSNYVSGFFLVCLSCSFLHVTERLRLFQLVSHSFQCLLSLSFSLCPTCLSLCSALVSFSLCLPRFVRKLSFFFPLHLSRYFCLHRFTVSLSARLSAPVILLCLHLGELPWEVCPTNRFHWTRQALFHRFSQDKHICLLLLTKSGRLSIATVKAIWSCEP